jgi:hypothetical protein
LLTPDYNKALYRGKEELGALEDVRGLPEADDTAENGGFALRNWTP